jgi:hypothetical protein
MHFLRSAIGPTGPYVTRFAPATGTIPVVACLMLEVLFFRERVVKAPPPL